MTDLTVENADALEKAEELQRQSTRRMAAEMAPNAILRIEKLAKGNLLPGEKGHKERPSAHVQLRANEAILNQAHGRPETRDGLTGQAEAGLVIVVNQLSTGQERVISGAAVLDDMNRGVRDAMGVAEQIQVRKLDGTTELLGTQRTLVAPPSGVRGGADEPEPAPDSEGEEPTPTGE